MKRAECRTVTASLDVATDSGEEVVINVVTVQMMRLVECLMGTVKTDVITDYGETPVMNNVTVQTDLYVIRLTVYVPKVSMLLFV